MRILVVGSGGREHAMCWRLKNEGHEVFCAPGNAGIAQFAHCIGIDVDKIDALLSYATSNQIELTIVGPEGPLVAGIANRFRQFGFLVCGPLKAAAKMEGSKLFFKKILKRHGIPTAPFKPFTDKGLATAEIQRQGINKIVIKADGLMAGKGVYLPENNFEVYIALKKLLVAGSADETVLVERRLHGPERSVMAFVDGGNAQLLTLTLDYKRRGDGNAGLMTGGMGAHTLSLPPEEEHILAALLQRVLNAFVAEGIHYQGFIYLGVMMTRDGPFVIECNCRLGDPETQVILTSMDGDFGEHCLATAKGTLQAMPPLVKVRESVVVALVSPEYPEVSLRDEPLFGIVEENQLAGVHVFDCGTKLREGLRMTNHKGRILNVVGTGGTVSEARIRAYEGAKALLEANPHTLSCRNDIGLY